MSKLQEMRDRAQKEIDYLAGLAERTNNKPEDFTQYHVHADVLRLIEALEKCVEQRNKELNMGSGGSVQAAMEARQYKERYDQEITEILEGK